jgi:hypothetical protein
MILKTDYYFTYLSERRVVAQFEYLYKYKYMYTYTHIRIIMGTPLLIKYTATGVTRTKKIVKKKFRI